MQPGTLNAVAYLAVGHVHVRALFELNENAGASEGGNRIETVEGSDGADFLFQGQRDLVEHLLRWRILPRYPDEQALAREPAREKFDRDADCGDDAYHDGAHQQDEHGDPSPE